MNISNVVEQYMSLRQALDAKRKEYKDFEASIKEEMTELELQILEVSNTTGVESFKTKFGTAYKTTQKFARSFDRQAVIDYAQRTGDFGLFTNHINKAHVIELMEEGEDPSAFGVDYQEEQTINIRKS